MALELTIVTPEGQSYDGTVDSVVLPGSEGEFGVLEGHERLLSALKPGPIEMAGGSAGGRAWAAVTHGFVEVTGERVVVLVDHCILADAIDADVAESERAAAVEELRSLSGAEENDTRRNELEQIIAASEARIEVASRARA